MPRRRHAVPQTPAIPPAALRVIRRCLLAWYDRAKRDLPWRRRPGDGYAQLLAEFMLQQTQVSVVRGYYERFLDRFPTLADLAAAEQGDVLALWSGLGYYSRARNLHAAARAIVERHSGVVPRDVESLLALPGIGRYTAGAIASIAYDVPAPVLDGNVARVLCRILALAGDPKTPATRDQLWTVAESLVPPRRCGDFNQSLMELGATVCTPQSPQCLICPLRSSCLASTRGLADQIPPPSRRPRVLEAETVVVAIRSGDRLLFMQRPQTGLWAGLWELPSEDVRAGEECRAALRRLRRRLTGDARIQPQRIGSVTRLLTHRRIAFHVYAGTWRGPQIARAGARWLRQDELEGVGLSRACQATLELLSASATHP